MSGKAIPQMERVTKAAKRLDVSVETIHRLSEDHGFPRPIQYAPGRGPYYVDVLAVIRWLEERSGDPELDAARQLYYHEEAFHVSC
jgi:hypothetical protein